MKVVYLLELRQLRKISQCYELYETYAYSSRKKVEAEIENIIKVNEGEITGYPKSTFDSQLKIVDYECYSTDGEKVKNRLIINKKELR